MTIDAVEAQWDSAIWNSATIQAITPNILRYELTQSSESELEKLIYGEQVNFFEVIITRSYGDRRIGAALKASNIYSVEIRYTKEQEPSGDNHRDVVRAFETLNTLVETDLGSDWNGTVDLFERQSDAISISSVKVAGRDCWQAVYRFQGRKFANI